MSDYPITIAREQLEDLSCCQDLLDAFKEVAPNGTLTIADVRAHSALLTTPLARYEEWAISRSIVPPIVVAVSDHGTATAGDYGTATAGDDGTATAGCRGTATAGYYGTSTAGNYGTASAGYRGTLSIRWHDNRAERWRLAVAYVGEPAPGVDKIQPNTPYKIKVVDNAPVWREVAE